MYIRVLMLTVGWGWRAPCVLFWDHLPTRVFGFRVYLAVRINRSSSVAQTVT